MPAKCQPFFLGLNVLTHWTPSKISHHLWFQPYLHSQPSVSSPTPECEQPAFWPPVAGEQGLHSARWSVNRQQNTVGGQYQCWPGPRKTRITTFWDTPATATWLPILVIHIRYQVITSQSYKFKKIAKNSNFEILPETLHATHIRKLLDKLYKYETDPISTVGATEQTRDVGWTMEWRTDTMKPIYPATTSLCGGYKNFEAQLKRLVAEWNHKRG